MLKLLDFFDFLKNNNFMDFTKLINLLNSRGFKATLFDTTDSAKEYILKESANMSVGIGGSMTIAELELHQALEAAGNNVFNHATVNTPETLQNAADAQVYMLSANALSMNGEIVNIDGRGNRVAGSLYGVNRKKVFYILGTNKIEENLERAMWRVKNIAAPKNAKRLSMKTPCAINADKCYNCNSPEKICRAMVIQKYPMFGVETHIVIINTPLGY